MFSQAGVSRAQCLKTIGRMRILVLTKRQYTSKDLIDDRYGRLFEIPAKLGALGHQVRGIALSYRRRGSGSFAWPDAPGVRWDSIDAFPFGALRYTRRIEEQLDGWRPDIVWASSDALHAVLGARVARRLGAPLVVDLYDNYESFGLTQLPGLRRAFRRACNQAAGVTVIGHALRRHVEETCRPEGLLRVLGNGVRTDLFKPRDRQASRHVLGLPPDGRYVGTAGALSADRGISDLFDAFLVLADADPSLHLVYAGPRDGTPARYRHPRMLDLGVLPWQQVPILLGALDVSVVCNRDSAFGRFCFPLKLQESIASGTPVVAAAVGEAARVLAGMPSALYPPGDIQALAAALKERVDGGDQPLPMPETWGDAAARVSDLFREVIDRAEPRSRPRLVDA